MGCEEERLWGMSHDKFPYFQKKGFFGFLLKR